MEFLNFGSLKNSFKSRKEGLQVPVPGRIPVVEKHCTRVSLLSCIRYHVIRGRGLVIGPEAQHIRKLVKLVLTKLVLLVTLKPTSNEVYDLKD